MRLIMKNFSGLIILFLFVLQNSYAQSVKSDHVIPYYPQEKMVYNLHVGPFTIGKAAIEFRDDSANCGSYLMAQAQSAGWIKIIKRITYKFDCCLDPETGLTRESSRVIVEGNFSDTDGVSFDHKSRPDSSIIYSKTLGKVIVTKNIPDILTAFYNYRANHLNSDLQVGDSVVIQTFFIDEIWPLTIRYAGKETINTNFGRVECLRIMPVTEVGRYFKTRDDLSIWITNNEALIPVKFHVNLRVASLTADLVGYKGPMYD